VDCVHTRLVVLKINVAAAAMMIGWWCDICAADED
jgi:hypothetical protein